MIKFQKDKSFERSKKILPEEATHFSDAVDKRIRTKYGGLLLRYQSSFVDARLTGRYILGEFRWEKILFGRCSKNQLKDVENRTK